MAPNTVEIRSTPDFDADLGVVPEQARRRIEEKVKSAAALLETDRKSFFARAQRPVVFRVGSGFESSLYVLRPVPRMRVIIAVDEDPLFGQFILTLLRAVPAESFEKEVGKVARRLYADMGGLKRVGAGHRNGKK